MKVRPPLEVHMLDRVERSCIKAPRIALTAACVVGYGVVGSKASNNLGLDI